MNILQLYYDIVNNQYVKNSSQNIEQSFDTLYYNDYKQISVQLLTPSSASTNSYPFDIVSPVDSVLLLNLGSIDATGSITNYTGSLLVASASFYTGSLNITGPNLASALSDEASITSIWQVKKYTSQSIDTLDSRNITIYKVLDGGTSIVPPTIYGTSASYAPQAMDITINSISASNMMCLNFTSSQTPITGAYASSSTFWQIQIGGVTRWIPLYQ